LFSANVRATTGLPPTDLDVGDARHPETCTNKRTYAPSLATGIDGRRVLKEIIPRHWEALAADVSFDADRALGHVRDIVARAPDEAAALAAELRERGLRNQTIDRLVQELGARCKGLESIYGAETAPSRLLKKS
jgi:hypothetical protein